MVLVVLLLTILPPKIFKIIPSTSMIIVWALICVFSGTWLFAWPSSTIDGWGFSLPSTGIAHRTIMRCSGTMTDFSQNRSNCRHGRRTTNPEVLRCFHICTSLSWWQLFSLAPLMISITSLAFLWIRAKKREIYAFDTIQVLALVGLKGHRSDRAKAGLTLPFFTLHPFRTLNEAINCTCFFPWANWLTRWLLSLILQCLLF